MGTLRLTAKEIGHITLFENLTGAVVKDCIVNEDENEILFIVKKGDMGLAIGRKGANIKKVKRAIDKKIDVIEYSDDPAEFIKNILNPFRIKGVELTDSKEKVAIVEIDDRDKTMAIGKRGRNIQRVKMLAVRHHGIKDIIIK